MSKHSRNVLALLLMLCFTFYLTGCSGSSESNQNQNNTSQSTQQSNNSTDVTSLKSFTSEELKKYNGQNGNLAYVAVSGKIYDVSNDRKWRNGLHESYKAGNDLTQDMQRSPHGNKVLNGLPVVGKLAD